MSCGMLRSMSGCHPRDPEKDVSQAGIAEVFQWGPDLKVIPLKPEEEAPGARDAEAKLAAEIFGFRR